MMKIEKLTPEQEAILPVFREGARRKGLRTHFASDDEMREAVVNLYLARGLSAPKVMVLADPVQCLLARAILRDFAGGKSQLWGQLWGQLGDQLWEQLRVQLWEQLEGQLGGQLWGQLGGQLRGQLWEQLEGQLGGQLWEQLEVQLREQLRGQLWEQLRGQLWEQLEGQLREQLRDQLWGQLGDAYQPLWFGGGSEFYWVAFYQFAERIGVKFSDEQSSALAALACYAETCGPLYAYDGLAFVSRKPNALCFDAQQRLHSEAGPAMVFSSGYALHAWHGTRIPSEWIEDKGNLKAQDVLAVTNVEQRMAGCQILGWAKVADQLNRRIIDGDPHTDIGALVELTLPGLPDPGRFLMAQCPRNGTICEGVPRVSDIDGLPIETAIAAQAWRDALPVAEYTHPTYRC